MTPTTTEKRGGWSVEHGRLFEPQKGPTTFVFPCHCVVREEDKALVMQSGWPAAAWREFGPEISLDAGYVIRQTAVNCIYGFQIVQEAILHGPNARPGLAMFQTRLWWYDDHDPAIIKISADGLAAHLRKYKRERIRMGFPGVGRGPLRSEDVIGILNDSRLQHWKSRVTLVFNTAEEAMKGGAP